MCDKEGEGRAVVPVCWGRPTSEADTYILHFQDVFCSFFYSLQEHNTLNNFLGFLQQKLLINIPSCEIFCNYREVSQANSVKFVTSHLKN